MDIGSQNFRFTLEDKNGLKEPTNTYRPPKTAELHLDSLDRFKAGAFPGGVVTGPLGNGSTITPANSQNFIKWIANFVLPTAQSKSTDLVLQNKSALIQGYFARVALTQFQLRYRLPTIIPGYNDLFYITFRNDGQFFPPANNTFHLPITIPGGSYTPATLASFLQTAISTSTLALAAFTCDAPFAAPNNLRNSGFRFAINNVAPANVAIALSFGETDAVDDDQSAANNLRVARTLYTLGLTTAEFWGYGSQSIGVPFWVAGPPPIFQAETAPFPFFTAVGASPKMFATDYVDIVSSSLTNYKEVKDMNTSEAAPMAVLGRVWLAEGANDYNSEFPYTAPYTQTALGMHSPITVVKSWQNPNWCQWSPNQTVNTIDIKLLDQWGDVLPWDTQYPSEWSATLTLTE